MSTKIKKIELAGLPNYNSTAAFAQYRRSVTPLLFTIMEDQPPFTHAISVFIEICTNLHDMPKQDIIRITNKLLLLLQGTIYQSSKQIENIVIAKKLSDDLDGISITVAPSLPIVMEIEE